MKNFFTQSLTYLYLGLLLSLISPIDVKSQIVSAPAGGNWNVPATWVGGSIPGAGDNVVIASTVSVTTGSQCNNITIQSGKVLQNSSTNNYTLIVNGNLSNQGTIQNDYYTLQVNVKGNVTNGGSMTNATLNFTGTVNQLMASTQPLNMANFVRTAGSGRVRATTNLSFVGTALNLNSDTLEFTTGSTLTINGGNLTNGVIFKSALPALQITGSNSSYVYLLIIDSPQTILNGFIEVNGNNNVFKHSVTNTGTLQNKDTNNYTLTIDGNLTNNGTIQNNYYHLIINITGDLTNNGIWQNFNTILNGSGKQKLAMTQPYSGTYFTKNLTTGRAVAIAGLSFLNTQIDLQADTLEFTTGNTIAIDGGNLRNGVIFKSSLPAIQLTGSHNAYVYALKIDAPQTALNDSLLFQSGNIFKTHLINNAIIKNHATNHYTLIVDGSFTNNGVIKNNYYNLTINISGNLSNNGTWQNYSTILNGIGNQDLSMTQAFSGEYFEKSATAGLASAISGLSFSGTKINFNNDTLKFTSGNALAMTGGFFSYGVLYKTAAPALEITSNGNYFLFVTVDATQSKLYGNLFISSGNTFKNDVINNGTLQNSSNNHYILTVDGNFTNNGAIKNNYFSFTMAISGNVANNGSWKNLQTTLTGTNNRTLTFSKSFEGTNFTKSVAAGNLAATTDLIFDGAAVDLNGSLLTLINNGYLSVLNGSFGDAVIAGTNIHINTLAGSCFSTQFSTDVSLHGVFQARAGISFGGNIVNEGTLRNLNNNNYSITVAGSVVNNGSITDNYYSLSITILGNITNNGTWNNYQTTLDGVADQYIYLNSTINGRILLDANNTGAGNWFGPSGTLVGNANFTGATGQVLTFVNPVTNVFAGQYYRTGSGGNSRSIYINTPANPARVLTMNFLLEGLYVSNGTMRASLDGNANPVFGANIADQVTIELHSSSNFSNILFTREGAQLGTNGAVSFNVPGNFSGSYYLAIRHRSGIVTVSATPVSFNTPTVNYSFNLLSKAYGNNMATTLDGHFALYGGDVNQDGIVDTDDMTPVDNEAAEYQNGYRNPDTNGDGVIDTADMTLVDNNAANYVAVVHP